MLKDVAETIETPRAKRPSFLLRTSERRVERMSVRYRSRQPDHAALRARLRGLATKRRRSGYRHLHVLM